MKKYSILLILFVTFFTKQIYAIEQIEAGDKILLRIAGIVDKTYEVNHAGYINFELWGGMLKVIDMTVPEASVAIQRQLSKYIRFRGRQPYVSLIKKGFDAQENFVSVFGEVKYPGSFPFKTKSVALDYILRAGGPTQLARTDIINITCGRGNASEVISFNLNTIATGKGKDIPRIVPGCIIFVPKKEVESAWLQYAPDKVVHIFGQVKKPGRYEFSEGFTLLDIISHAGGLTDIAKYTELVIVSNNLISQYDLREYLVRGGKLPEIKKGDAIFIPSRAVSQQWMELKSNEVVHVIGEVNKPGRYAFDKNFTFMDILSHAGGVTDKARTSEITIISGKNTSYFNMDEYAKKGGALPQINLGDTVYVPKVASDDWLNTSPENSIYLVGEFIRPGRYGFKEGFSILDFISQAGGPKESADIKRIKIIRDNQPLEEFDLFAYQQGKTTKLPAVHHQDIIYIPIGLKQQWVKSDPKSVVNVLGEVEKPGRYEVEPDNLSIINIIAAAGGPTDSADITKIKVMHQTALLNQDNQIDQLDVEEFDLNDFQNSGDVNKLPNISNGDTIMVSIDKETDWGFWDDFRTIGGALGIIALVMSII